MTWLVLRDYALAGFGWLIVSSPLIALAYVVRYGLSERQDEPDPMQSAHLNDARGQWPKGPTK